MKDHHSKSTKSHHNSHHKDNKKDHNNPTNKEAYSNKFTLSAVSSSNTPSFTFTPHHDPNISEFKLTLCNSSSSYAPEEKIRNSFHIVKKHKINNDIKNEEIETETIKKLDLLKNAMLDSLDLEKKKIEENFENMKERVRQAIQKKVQILNEVVRNVRKGTVSDPSLDSAKSFDLNTGYHKSDSETISLSGPTTSNDSDPILLSRDNNNNNNNTQSSYFDSPSREVKSIYDYRNNNIINKIEDFERLNELILDSLQSNFVLYNNLLSLDFILSQNPIQDFVNKNSTLIFDSWLFNKLDFDCIDLLKIIENNNSFSENLKKCIFNDTKEKFINLKIEPKQNNDMAVMIMQENQNKLQKITFDSLENNEFNKIFNKMDEQGISLIRLKELYFNFCTAPNCRFPNFYPSVELVSADYCSFNLSLRSNNDFLREFKTLKHLILKNCHIDNNQFIYIMQSASNNLKSIEHINLNNNLITEVELDKHLGTQIKTLNSLLLKNNCICKFSTKTMDIIPNLNILDLTGNSLTDYRHFEPIFQSDHFNILIFLNQNQCLLNFPNHLMNYIKLMKKKLRLSDFFMDYIDLSYLFNKRNQDDVKDIILHATIQTSIESLNLSRNSLNSTNSLNFLINNSSLINLKELVLINNDITDVFLISWIENEFYSKFENLENLNLKGNKFSNNSFHSLFKLIEYQTNLKRVNLSRNPLENIFDIIIDERNSITKEIIKEHHDLNEFFRKCERILKQKNCQLILGNKAARCGYPVAQLFELTKLIKFEN